MKSLENKGKKMTGTFNRSDLQGALKKCRICTLNPFINLYLSLLVFIRFCLFLIIYDFLAT